MRYTSSNNIFRYLLYRTRVCARCLFLKTLWTTVTITVTVEMSCLRRSFLINLLSFYNERFIELYIPTRDSILSSLRVLCGPVGVVDFRKKSIIDIFDFRGLLWLLISFVLSLANIVPVSICLQKCFCRFAERRIDPSLTIFCRHLKYLYCWPYILPV